MQPVLNVEDVKRVEVALTRVGVSVSELMHRAGYAAAQEVLSLPDSETIVVLTGMGNNGGDGWVAAETLKAKGRAVQVVTPIDPDDLRGDLARVVAQSAVNAGVPIIVGPSRPELEALLEKADVVLDCMLGTGFEGELRAPFDIWIDCLNSSGARVVAVDVPSGLSAQTGAVPSLCVVADLTVTMLALKPGLLADRGRSTPIPSPGARTSRTTSMSSSSRASPSTSSPAARSSWWAGRRASPVRLSWPRRQQRALAPAT